MSETNIENDERYKHTIKRVDAGVSFLVWFAVYATAITVVLLDVFVWRP
jgi:hypothetical protein